MSKRNKPAPTETVGVYMYLGPSIHAVIQNGTIFHGTLTEIKQKLSAVLEKYPKVERFLILDKDIPEFAEKIKKTSSLSNDYKELAKK